MNNSKPIMLVEDDTIDTMTVKRAFKVLKILNKLITVENGEEALAYLKDKQNNNPCLILLDLNMPRMNGIEFLKIAKSDEILKRIPVVVLTTSTEEHDRTAAFKNGVAGYMAKPVEYNKFLKVINTIYLYWTLCKLPQK